MEHLIDNGAVEAYSNRQSYGITVTTNLPTLEARVERLNVVLGEVKALITLIEEMGVVVEFNPLPPLPDPALTGENPYLTEAYKQAMLGYSSSK